MNPRDTEQPPAANFGDTLALINQRMVDLGDLPIFSSTVNRIQVATSADNVDAMVLADEVLKDANLTTKLLRLANSAFYSRSFGHISSVSKAVVIMGFETLKNMCLTLKLIESFQHEHPGANLEQVLVNSYLTAGFVREVAAKTGAENVENAYICGLLHDLGEIVVAYTLPERYEEILNRFREGEETWDVLQKQVLGGRFAAIGQRLARSWGFPTEVVDTMVPLPKTTHSGSNTQNLNHTLVALSHDVLLRIGGRHGASEDSFSDALTSLGKAAGIGRDKVEEALATSYRQSRILARDYGLDETLLSPTVTETEDELLSKTLRQLSTIAGRGIAESEQEPDQSTIDTEGSAKDTQLSEPSVEASTEVSGDTSPAEDTSNLAAKEQVTTGGNPIRQLQTLQEITALITENAGVHRVLLKVAEGLHEGVGLERVVLCLLSSDQSHLMARLVIGEQGEPLKQYFNIPLADSQNLFVATMLEGEDRLVRAADDGRPTAFETVFGANDFLIAPLRANGRPVAMFYADNGVTQTPISDAAYGAFVQFVSQSKLALHYFEMARSKKN